MRELSQSNVFVDADGSGLLHRSAVLRKNGAAAGDGVLFYDAGNDGKISEKREYVFTAWDSAASDDFAALHRVFDTNSDGKLTASDAEFAKFKVMVTQAANDNQEAIKAVA